MRGGDDNVARNQGRGARFLGFVGVAAHEAPRQFLRVDPNSVVTAEEMVVDAHRPLAAMAIGAIGARFAAAARMARLLAHAIEGGGASVVLIAHPGNLAAIGAIGSLHAGAGAEIRFVALAVAGPAAGIVLALAQGAAIGIVGCGGASPGADVGLVAFIVVGVAAAVIAAPLRLGARGLLVGGDAGAGLVGGGKLPRLAQCGAQKAKPNDRRRRQKPHAILLSSARSSPLRRVREARA